MTMNSRPAGGHSAASLTQLATTDAEHRGGSEVAQPSHHPRKRQLQLDNFHLLDGLIDVLALQAKLRAQVESQDIFGDIADWTEGAVNDAEAGLRELLMMLLTGLRELSLMLPTGLNRPSQMPETGQLELSLTHMTGSRKVITGKLSVRPCSELPSLVSRVTGKVAGTCSPTQACTTETLTMKLIAERSSKDNTRRP